jgi:hypothetical protein
MSVVGETPLLHCTYSTSHEVKTYLSTTLKHRSLHVRAKYGKITSHFSLSRSFSSATRRVLDRNLASRTMQSATYLPSSQNSLSQPHLIPSLNQRLNRRKHKHLPRPVNRAPHPANSYLPLPLPTYPSLPRFGFNTT